MTNCFALVACFGCLGDVS